MQYLHYKKVEKHILSEVMRPFKIDFLFSDFFQLVCVRVKNKAQIKNTD